jgi:hypothetical protein
VTAVLASLMLAAVFACPCPAMTADRHGCCGDEGSRIAPSDCCRPAANAASWTPRSAVPAPAASPLAIAVEATLELPSPPRTISANSLPASPPRVLRI